MPGGSRRWPRSSLAPDDLDRIEACWKGSPRREPTEIVERAESRRLPPRRIDEREIGQRNERRHGLACPFDDDPLPGGGFIHDLPESAPYVKGRHGSHGHMIAPSWSLDAAP